MKKTEFVKAYAEKMGIAQKEAEKMYKGFEELVKDALKEHGVLNLTDFVKFEVKDTSAREGRNPKTGEKIQIPAGKKVSVKALTGLKGVTE